jgi:hypothetical protein
VSKRRKGTKAAEKVSRREPVPLPKEIAFIGILLTSMLLLFYTLHCIWVSADVYSAPSIVLQTRNADGTKHTLDDFREAYAWLRCVSLVLSPKFAVCMP